MVTNWAKVIEASKLRVLPAYERFHQFVKRHGRSPYCKLCGHAKHYRLHQVSE